MLARIAHDLYWLGRHLVRAEHTARMLDGLFHADLQGRADDPTSVTLSWQSLLAIMGAADGGGPARRDGVIRLLTTAPDNPVSIVSCVGSAREVARTLRDTISAEMWESVNTYHLQLMRRDLDAGLRAGPYSIYTFVKERSALFWGLTARTMQKDEARAFLVAGGRIEAADMVLRMLRVALPPEEDAPPSAGSSLAAGPGGEAPRRDGNALALLRAVGGSRRSCEQPPRLPTPRRCRGSCCTTASSRTRWRHRCNRWTARSSASSSTRRTRRPCCACGGCSRTSTSGHGWRPRPMP
jgi:uncharacterized alpha-E superfamily protein